MQALASISVTNFLNMRNLTQDGNMTKIPDVDTMRMQSFGQTLRIDRNDLEIIKFTYQSRYINFLKTFARLTQFLHIF